MAFDENAGISSLAAVLRNRMKRESTSPPVLDFGEIQENGSLLADTFPEPIPKGDYSVCRQLTLGMEGEQLAKTDEDPPEHTVTVPEKMRGLLPGDRVLVAWVQDEAVVIDIISE